MMLTENVSILGDGEKKIARQEKKKAKREARFDNFLEPLFSSAEKQLRTTFDDLLGGFGVWLKFGLVVIVLLLLGLIILQYKNLSVNINR